MYQPQPGIRQIRRQQWEQKQAQQQREQALANKAAQQAVINSVKS